MCFRLFNIFMLGRKFFPRLFKLKFITKKGKFVKE